MSEHIVMRVSWRFFKRYLHIDRQFMSVTAY